MISIAWFSSDLAGERKLQRDSAHAAIRAEGAERGQSAGGQRGSRGEDHPRAEGRGGQVKVFIARKGKSTFQYQIRADTKSGEFENTRSAEISTRGGGARGKGESTMKSFGNTHTLDREFFKRFSLKMVLIKLSSKRRFFSSTRFRDWQEHHDDIPITQTLIIVEISLSNFRINNFNE